MEEKYTERPETITRVDAERSMLVIQIGLIDIEEENITLMISDTGFSLSASSDNLDYVAADPFFSPVDSGKAKASYEDGYLTIEVPIKDLSGFTKIKVNQ